MSITYVLTTVNPETCEVSHQPYPSFQAAENARKEARRDGLSAFVLHDGPFSKAIEAHATSKAAP